MTPDQKAAAIDAQYAEIRRNVAAIDRRINEHKKTLGESIARIRKLVGEK